MLKSEEQRAPRDGRPSPDSRKKERGTGRREWWRAALWYGEHLITEEVDGEVAGQSQPAPLRVTRSPRKGPNTGSATTSKSGFLMLHSPVTNEERPLTVRGDPHLVQRCRGHAGYRNPQETGCAERKVQQSRMSPRVTLSQSSHPTRNKRATSSKDNSQGTLAKPPAQTQ